MKLLDGVRFNRVLHGTRWGPHKGTRHFNQPPRHETDQTQPLIHPRSDAAILADARELLNEQMRAQSKRWNIPVRLL